jgi:hypothetical protein
MRHAEDVNQYFHHIAWCPRQFGTMQDWHVDSTDMFLYIDRSIIYTLFHSLPAQSLRSSITSKPPIVLHRDFGNVLKCSVHWKQPLQIQLLCFASQILFPASAQDLRVISQTTSPRKQQQPPKSLYPSPLSTLPEPLNLSPKRGSIFLSSSTTASAPFNLLNLCVNACWPKKKKAIEKPNVDRILSFLRFPTHRRQMSLHSILLSYCRPSYS